MRVEWCQSVALRVRALHLAGRERVRLSWPFLRAILGGWSSRDELQQKLDWFASLAPIRGAWDWDSGDGVDFYVRG
jgi:hypothetical protein